MNKYNDLFTVFVDLSIPFIVTIITEVKIFEFPKTINEVLVSSSAICCCVFVHVYSPALVVNGTIYECEL